MSIDGPGTFESNGVAASTVGAEPAKNDIDQSLVIGLPAQCGVALSVEDSSYFRGIYTFKV